MRKLHIPLSLTLCATGANATAQELVPMINTRTQDDPLLTRMEPMAKPVAIPLQPMSGGNVTLRAMTEPAGEISLRPMQSQVAETSATLVAMISQTTVSATYTPMVTPTEDVDVVLTPLARGGASEIMHGRQNKTVRSPVPGLEGLTARAVATTSGAKPLRLKGTVWGATATNARPMIAATTTLTTSGTEPVSFPNMLTDAELSPNASIPTIKRPEEELVMADVVVNKIPRHTLMEIYQDDRNNIWLPLTGMAQLLEIPLAINASAGVAQGWYQSPTNTLVLTMASNKITIGKQTGSVSGKVEKHDADLYITASALKDWFGVDTKFDYNELRIFFTTPGPLPGDLHAARTDKWGALEQARQRQAMPSDTIIPDYANFSLPVMRLGASTNFSSPASGNAALSTGLTLQAENDLFGTNSNLTLAFANVPDGTSGLVGGSLLLQKRSEKDDLLGPLKARYFGIGDINTDPIPLSGISSRGRGVRANNLPEGTVNNPDQYVLTGPAPINWDVEVYQNATLVAYSRIDNSGTYRFTALPLRAGSNVFRLVFYGPNGERDERRQTIYLADNIPTPGEWRYDTSVFQPNRSLIPGLPNEPSSTLTTAQAQFTTGLVNNWAATMGVFQSVGKNLSPEIDNNPDNQGASAGLRGSVGGTYLTADILAGDKGQGIQGTFRTPITQDIDLRLAQQRNIGYNAIDRDQLESSQAELSLPFSLGKTALDTSYGYTHTTYQTQQPRNDISQRTSMALGPINATNQLNFTTQGLARSVNGTLEATSHMLDTIWRTGLIYQPDSEDLMRQFYVNTQVPVGKQTVNLTYTQNMTHDDHSGNLAGSMYWRTGPFAVGVNGLAGTDGNIQAGLNLTTALVPQDYGKAKWKLTSPNAVIGQGKAAVRVYADENNNNQYDPGEALLPNVIIYNRLRGSQQVTNNQGIATFSDLAPNTLARLELDLTSLPDIYLKPVSDTLNVKPHTGDNGILNYAVKIFGEISGQAFTGTKRPVQNLEITLRDAAGDKVDSTVTESDGFYTFGALPMGTYTITSTNAAIAATSVTLTPKARVKTQEIRVTAP